jgi:hypothetical protein
MEIIFKKIAIASPCLKKFAVISIPVFVNTMNDIVSKSELGLKLVKNETPIKIRLIIVNSVKISNSVSLPVITK